MSTSAVPTLDALQTLGILRPIDVHFARTVARISSSEDPLVLLALAVAARAPGSGHTCAELDSLGSLVRLDDGRADDIHWPSTAKCAAALADSDLIGDGAGKRRPLVLDGPRLYLDRYWRYQDRLLAALRDRAAIERPDAGDAETGRQLDALFPATAAAPDMQRVAAAVAILRNLTVISGGPGTGKTTTIVKVLALLIARARDAGLPAPRILLAAPTGKAAARMVDAIRNGRDALPVSQEIKNAIPDSAATIHRMLGVDRERPTRFRHAAEHPLAADIVVVDEVSMVDLALMTKLVDAVPPNARLILVGDRNQLASVEAGCILGDLCGSGGVAMSAAFAGRVSKLSGVTVPGAAGDTLPAIGDCIVELRHSHRFGAGSGIGALARAVNDGDEEAMLEVLAGDRPDVRLRAAGPDAADARLVRAEIVDGYRSYLTESDPAKMLRELDRFRVLCAHREGAFGVAGLNDAIGGWLQSENLIASRSGSWWHGQPIMVLENNYDVGLFNGDVGVVVKESGRLRACFPSAEGDGVRSVAPARLPAMQTVFAMTVHKAQGSEFERALFVLPPRPTPLLTRELLYTAISRARSEVTVFGRPEVLVAAIRERVQRNSGLSERLWKVDANARWQSTSTRAE